MAKFIDDIFNERDRDQSDFRQAVREVFEDIEDVYKDNKAYQKASILKRLTEADRIIQFRVCWQDDKGEIHVNRGWRVQHTNTLGAYKGGLRFHPSVTVDTLKFLAFEQSFKNALTGFPMGGGKGGSDFDPKGKSNSEIMRFCHAFMDELYRHIGAEIDVPAGDINVGSREIGYLFGRHIKLTNTWQGGLTGKKPIYGGSFMRTEATGYGAVYMLEQALNAHDLKIKDQRVVISGAGNVALHAAEKLIDMGATVLTLSDSKGFLYFEKGMSRDDIKTIKNVKLDEGGALVDLDIGEYKKGAEPWSVKSDIVMPCATQNEVNGTEAQILVDNDVTVIVEGANMPLTAEAQNIIMSNKIIYVPGKAANAGGVAVSALERSQNARLVQWDFDDVDQRLQKIMKDIHDRCIENVEKIDGIYPYRKGANIYGFKKLADTLIAYGIH